MLIAMYDETGRLVGAGTSGESLVKSLQNVQPLAKASTPGKRVVLSRQKPKTPSRSHPWRQQAFGKTESHLENLAKALAKLGRGTPMLKSFSAQGCTPDQMMHAALQQLPVEHRQPHVVRELRSMGVAI